MNRFLPLTLAALTLLAALPLARATSVLPLTLDEHIRASDAIFRGTVMAVMSYKDPADGMIYTRTSLRVDEAFKGKFPPVINLIHRGGEVAGIGNRDDLSPQFKVGEERLLLVSRRGDGTLFATQGETSAIRLQRETQGALVQAHQDLLNRIRIGTDFGRMPGADVTGQAANMAPDSSISAPSGDNGGASTNGLLVDGFGVPWRYSTPDRGETIPYLVDTNSLPAGITPAQALNAVNTALSAWAGASSFKFVFIGTQNFGKASPNINTNDGIFRIQLHDNFNFIPAGNILGEGGSYFSVGLLTNANWGPGGNVAGTEFNAGQCGYVVLKHTNIVMQTLSTFTEVLTHEIGHVMGLAHSSNIVTNNPVLTNSVMYFLAHADGRGASLNSYDTNVVRELHPLNTPPYSYSRVMDIITASPTPNTAGINEVQVRGYDLQSTNLSLSLTNQTLFNGIFSNANSTIRYNPNSFFGDSTRDDPADFTTDFDRAYARYSDGTNASPYVTVRVLSFSGDDFPFVSDGIPDYWMTAYFGHADPQAGDKSRATDDADGDGMNNLNEYRAGMNPTNRSSAQRITGLNAGTLQWQAKAYELYEILGSANLTNWTRIGNPVLPTNAPLSVRTNLLAAGFTATVSNLPTTNGQMFFRVLKVP